MQIAIAFPKPFMLKWQKGSFIVGCLKRWQFRGIFITSLLITVYALSALFSSVNAATNVPELDTDVTPLSAQSLANSVLGGSLTATNATSRGTIYTFSHGINTVGIDSGIILETSGRISSNNYQDSDLKSIMDYSYGGDTAMLEFTIVATGNLLNFNYVFVSTEFDQDPKFNDNFGLFVSINGGAYHNIATIPLTTGAEVPININNLRSGIDANHETTRASISAETAAHNYQQHSLFNSAPININNSVRPINGVSNVFNAQQTVTPGDIVKIKFAIADVSDSAYDSYVLIEADSLSFEEQMARVNYSREVIEKMYSGRTYEVTDSNDNTYVFTSSSNGEVPLAGTDNNGQDYDFMGDTIELVRKGIGSMPDSDPQVIVVANRPSAPDETISVPTGEPDDIYLDGIEITENSISLKGNAGQEYSLDQVDWQSPDENGYVSFENLTPNTEYTAYTRFEATDEAPASASTPIGTILTQNMARSLTYTIVNYEGLYDGEPHAAYITDAGVGTEIRYSESLYGTYTGEIPHFINPGSYTVYYYLSRDNYYPAYGALTVKIKDYNVINATDEDHNFGHAQLLHTSAELKQMIDFTEEEKESLADTETPAEISLVVEDVTEAVSDDVSEKFVDNLEGTEHLGKVVDLSLYQKLLVSPTKLTDLSTPVHISFEIPDSLVLKDEEKAVRAYRVLRLHDSEVETIDAELDENRVLSFSTDKFSYFAITYSDIAYATDDDDSLIPDTFGITTPNLRVPDTGEMGKTLGTAKTCAIITVVMGIISAVVVLYTYGRLKGLKMRLSHKKSSASR